MKALVGKSYPLYSKYKEPLDCEKLDLISYIHQMYRMDLLAFYEANYLLKLIRDNNPWLEKYIRRWEVNG